MIGSGGGPGGNLKRLDRRKNIEYTMIIAEKVARVAAENCNVSVIVGELLRC